MKLAVSFFVLLVSVVLITGCSESRSNLALTKSEPSQDAVLTQSPQSIHLFFDFAPNAQTSVITLSGPDGEIPLMGTHTMGMNDLMIMVNHPPLADGDYTVSWQASSFENNVQTNGNYSFSVQL